MRLIASLATSIVAGNGEAVQKAGTRLFNQSVSVQMDTTVRRTPGGSMCHMEQFIVAAVRQRVPHRLEAIAEQVSLLAHPA